MLCLRVLDWVEISIVPSFFRLDSGHFWLRVNAARHGIQPWFRGQSVDKLHSIPDPFKQDAWSPFKSCAQRFISLMQSYWIQSWLGEQSSDERHINADFLTHESPRSWISDVQYDFFPFCLPSKYQSSATFIPWCNAYVIPGHLFISGTISGNTTDPIRWNSIGL